MKTFEMFMTFIMNWIKLEPNLWIKSSEQYRNITKELKERFGENLGAEPGVTAETMQHEPTDLDDERVIKQNMNAIQNYKRYVESVKEIR